MFFGRFLRRQHMASIIVAATRGSDQQPVRAADLRQRIESVGPLCGPNAPVAGTMSNARQIQIIGQLR